MLPGDAALQAGNGTEQQELVIPGVCSVRVPVCGRLREEVERSGTESESPAWERHAGNAPQRGLVG